jgi:hypothetical protein
LVVALVLIGLCAWLNFRTNAVTDPDSLYHFGHAMVYSERGALDQGFPWTSASATGHYDGDLWWGFHVVLVPFTFLGDPVTGLKAAATVALALGCFLLYLAARRVSARFAWAAPLLVLLAGSVETGRLIALRPQAISIGLFAWVAVSICTRDVRAALLTGLAVGYLHATLSWLAVLIALLVGLVVSIGAKKALVAAPLALVSGVVVSILLRPGAIDSLHLLRIQIFELSRAKAQGVPLPFGLEVFPMSSEVLLRVFPLFLVVWLVCLASLSPLMAREKSAGAEVRGLIVSAAAVSVIGFLITVFASYRGLDIWLVFGALAVMGLTSLLVRPLERRYATVALAAIVAALGAFAVTGHVRAMANDGIDPNRMKPAMLWLRDNSAPSEIVGTIHWDLFGEMFFHNRKNRYVEGMDPIFLYAQDPEMFWKLHNLDIRAAASHTAGTPIVDTPQMVDTIDVFRRELGAGKVLLLKWTTPELEMHMRNDARCSVGYEDDFVVVFRLR